MNCIEEVGTRHKFKFNGKVEAATKAVFEDYWVTRRQSFKDGVIILWRQVGTIKFHKRPCDTGPPERDNPEPLGISRIKEDTVQ